MTLKAKSIELPNHVKLQYVEQGDPAGVPVIFLHAIADSWHVFERVVQYLPDWIHAFALTQRGHGDASRPAAGYRPDDFAKDAAAFMDELHLESAVIAGGSSGGFIARRFAIDYPERILALVLIGAPLKLSDKPGVREMWDSTFSTFKDPVEPGFVHEFAQSTIERQVPPEVIETLERENLKVPASVWKATMAGLLEDDFDSKLTKIKVPTLITWGDKDAIVPQSDQEALAALIPDARLIVYEGGGHLFYVEEPDRFASDLAAFVEDIAKKTTQV